MQEVTRLVAVRQVAELLVRMQEELAKQAILAVQEAGVQVVGLLAERMQAVE